VQFSGQSLTYKNSYLTSSFVKQMPWFKKAKPFDVFVDSSKYTPSALKMFMGKNYRVVTTLCEPIKHVATVWKRRELSREYGYSLEEAIQSGKL